jgi:hypothetical protein
MANATTSDRSTATTQIGQDDTPYQYQPISKESRDIRLLLLQPGKFESRIECVIQNASLDQDDLEYEALSYVWGDDSVRVPIWVNSRKTEVTINLEQALRHLRSEDNSITIWADALSINQSDLEEKTHQVRMMREIYKKCSRGIVWLGSTGDNAEDKDPFQFFYHFAENKHLYELPGFTYDAVEEKYQYTDDVEESFQQPLWCGLRTIAQSPWWTRIWTVQEATLPPETRIVYGHWRTSWDNLEITNEKWGRHGADCCAQAYDILPMQLLQECEQVLSETHYINEARRSLVDPFSLLSLAHMYSFKLATNPRDKIFGLLGLTSESVYQSFSPDYTLNLNEVFEITFCNMVAEEGGSLRCFLGSWFHSEPSSTQSPPVADLPSWVPNFSHKISHRLCRVQIQRRFQYDVYDTSRGRTSQVVLGDNSTIHASGCLVGKAWVISDFSAAKTQHIREHFKHLLHHIESNVGKFNPTEREAFYRTILGDLLHATDLNRRQDVPWVKISAIKSFSFDTWLAGERANGFPDTEFVISLDTATHGRKFFKTASGSIGLCPPHTKPGDEIWVLYGCRVPLIFRAQSEEGRRHYTLIGDCYLDGIMNGEAMSNPLYEEHSMIIK